MIKSYNSILCLVIILFALLTPSNSHAAVRPFIELFEQIFKFLGKRSDDVPVDDVGKNFENFKGLGKSDELKEYKKGYDYSKNKSIIDGVIETIDFIENAEKKVEIKDEILRSYFSTTKDKLIIILSNSGIEPFKPKLNSQSLDDHGCEVDVNTEKTDDEKKNNLIYQVLKDGYKIQLTDSNTKIVRKALVKVYEFKKNNDNVKEIWVK